MTTRRFFLLLMLIFGGPSFVRIQAQPASSQPQIYRWKDSRGKLYITTTPPPQGATVLGLPPEKNTKAHEIAKPLPRVGPVVLSAPQNRALSESQRGFWQTLAQTMGDARAKGDRAALETSVDRIFQDSFWGSGLWVLLALPAASFLLLVLLGWLLAGSLKGAKKVLTLALFMVVGLVLADLTLIQFVFKTQAQRLSGNLALLQLNLGGEKTLSVPHKEELEARMKRLETGAAFSSVPWQFPAEAQALKSALREMVVDP